jgi:beta-fructofuranosidase
VAWTGEEARRPVSLRLFLDHTVLEAYINGRACATKVISPSANDLGLGLFAEDGEMRLRSLEVWRLQSIWSQP